MTRACGVRHVLEIWPPAADRGTRALLTGAVVLQFAFLVSTILEPMTPRVWAARGQPALLRSARLSYGHEFAAYILFLREAIPEEALVVLPPADVDQVLGHMGFMQYFLFPRRLTNCPEIEAWEECRVHYSGPQTYILAINEFPPGEHLGLAKRYIRFNDRWGVYAPPDD